MKSAPFQPCSKGLVTAAGKGSDGQSYAQGFSLVEMVVVLAILGFLLGAVVMPVATQHEIRKFHETERMLREIKQALIGFAIVNGRLPCPDVDTDPSELPVAAVDGLEDCDAVQRGIDEGYLPWSSLTLRPTDTWGHLFYYRVTPEFTYRAVAGAPPGEQQLDLEDVGDLKVRTRGDNPASGQGSEGKEPILLASTAPAVVISYGANGSGARNIDGDVLARPGIGTDEADNVPGGDRAFMTRLHTRGGENCNDTDESKAFCEYDDLMIWLSRPVLIGELMNGGVLP